MYYVKHKQRGQPTVGVSLSVHTCDRDTARIHAQAAIKDGACFSSDFSNIACCEAISMVTLVSWVTPVTVAMAS